jgi:hypothetical protein
MDFSDNRTDLYSIPYIAHKTSIAHYRRKERMWKIAFTISVVIGLISNLALR